MTRGLKVTSEMSAGDKKLLDDIKRVGWHVINVFSPGNETPEWSFSIGLFHSFGHPEVIIFGLPRDRRAAIVNQVGRQVQTGKIYQAGSVYPDILADSYRCMFSAVPSPIYRDYVGYALWFYENDQFPLFQCFWPDKQGLFPWNDGCNDDVRVAQPVLFSE